jgi:hypothetical protein
MINANCILKQLKLTLILKVKRMELFVANRPIRYIKLLQYGHLRYSTAVRAEMVQPFL